MNQLPSPLLSAASPLAPQLNYAATHSAAIEESDLQTWELECLSYASIWLESMEQNGRWDQATPDPDDLTWFVWLLLGGRGAGKTRSGAEWCWQSAMDMPGARIAIVAPTSADVRKTCIEGESGLIARAPPSFIVDYNRQEMKVTFANGAAAYGYSAEEPNRLRGPQHNLAWCDELAAWRYLDDTLDMLMMGLRLGKTPRICATTTPRPIKRLKEIINDSATRLSSASTYANRANLPKMFFDQVLKRYEGTRLGRQELLAEILDDVPGALWNRANLEQNRILPDPKTKAIILPDMVEKVIAVDPPGKSGPGHDEAGIVCCGRGTDNHGYVLNDYSLNGTPDEWGKAAVRAYDAEKAGWIVYEENQGGEMVAATIRSCARALRDEGERDTDFVPLIPVWASRGKAIRAEPISALYAQNRVHHVGVLAKLEDQQCEFTPDFDRDVAGYSPDRLDACVWGLTQVMTVNDQTSGLQEFYRQEAAKVRDKVAGKVLSGPAFSCLLVPPPGVNMAHGKSGKKYIMRPDGLIDVTAEEDVNAFLAAGFRRFKAETTKKEGE